MYIVHVHTKVMEEYIEDFRRVTIENARSSIQEPGVARFDVLQNKDDPGHFVLVEVYRTFEDPARHKETPHYARWRDAVAEMMVEPRKSVKFDNVFPEDSGWG